MVSRLTIKWQKSRWHGIGEKVDKSMEHNRELKNEPKQMGQLLAKEQRQFNGVGIVFSTNVAKTIEPPYKKKT